jgi:transglutaminase-like putative cysteine protease
MAVTVSLNHTTHYKYERPTSLSPQTIRLRPAPHCRTPILSYGLKVSPANHFLNWIQDPQGNYQARVIFPEKVSEFKVEVSVVAEMVTINPFDFFVESYAESFPFEYESTLKDELDPYLDPPKETGALWEKLYARIDRSEGHIVDFLVRLNTLVMSEVSYLIRMEPGIQAPEETLEKAAGSCRDRQPIKNRSMGPVAPKKILPIYMPGLKYTYPAQGGLAWMQPRGFWRERAIFRWPVRPTRFPPVPFQDLWRT